MADYPDGTYPVDIIAQDLAVVAVDIATQTLANLGVDIKAQTLANLAVDIAAQTLTSLGINIKAQDLAQLVIKIAAQSVSIEGGKEWAAIQDDDLSVVATGNFSGNNTWVTILTYTVPAATSAYISQLHLYTGTKILVRLQINAVTVWEVYIPAAVTTEVIFLVEKKGDAAEVITLQGYLGTTAVSCYFNMGGRLI